MNANLLHVSDNSKTTPWAGLALPAIIYVVAYLSWTFFQGGGEASRQLVNSIALLPLRALTVLLAWQISNHAPYERRSRHAWKLLSLAFFALFVGDCLRLVSGGGIEASLLASVLSGVFYLLLLFGLLTFLTCLSDEAARGRVFISPSTNG